MEGLNRYDRATVALWARSHTELSKRSGNGPIPEVAVHATLAGLRSRCTEATALFTCYEADAAADFALIGSLLPGTYASELLWQVRDAAFHLHWLELTGGDR